MIVHAHPDDESSQTGGTLARYAAEGCRTILVTCTDGALGDAEGGAKPGEPGHDPRQVAQHRAHELAAAAAALGVHDLIPLAYPDSGMPGPGGYFAPESFSQRPTTPMVTQLVRLMRLHQPDVVVTYPPNGMSGHPDHIRTHEIVVAAHANIVANADGPGPRLYYIALSVTRLRAAQASVRAAFGDDAWLPPDELGVADADITTVLDVAQFWDAKLRALAAHASQADAAMLLKMFSSGDRPATAGSLVEEYVRAYPATVADGVVEADFFA
jgi:LmbE family N-acetylglucosaminyl deacetylase